MPIRGAVVRRRPTTQMDGLCSAPGNDDTDPMGPFRPVLGFRRLRQLKMAFRPFWGFASVLRPPTVVLTEPMFATLRVAFAPAPGAATKKPLPRGRGSIL
jgi:hypothetical protein